jgi:hypothetical protein
VISSRIHVFLWLLSNNKLLTRDNLRKRRRGNYQSCLFCAESESISHLFFDCTVASQAWKCVSDLVGFPIGQNYEFVAKCWLCNKRFGVVNILTSAVCLEFMEGEKLDVFPGCMLERHERHVAAGGADDELSEGVGASEDGGGLRRCAQFLGKPGGTTGADRLPTPAGPGW